MVECIRPLLPTIRTTPYGKRIHSKIFRDTKSNAGNNKPQFAQQQQQQRPTRHDGLPNHHFQENDPSYQ